MKIVVVGGTGLIGSKVTARLRARGHEAVAAAPGTGVNAATGEGLAEVLKGASIVIDVSRPRSLEERAAIEFFRTSTHNLLSYGAKVGVAHHVALSVVGADRLQESPYMRAKLSQETLIKESGRPYSIVRATQFFEFVESIADAATVGTQVRVPPSFVQPVSGDDAASAIAKVAVGAPLTGTVEVAGPERFRLEEFVRRALRARNDPREVVADQNALYFGARLSDVTLIASGEANISETRFDDWLSPAISRQ